ncbi:hypothetical protein AB6B38_09585 [Glycocaulis abyssi]|uniref:Uncharacterized protein n=1 Tax=Glycocaulis abyssi TaxID=1433403 RepID=A0ABV9NGC2_9PROT
MTRIMVNGLIGDRGRRPVTLHEALVERLRNLAGVLESYILHMA